MGKCILLGPELGVSTGMVTVANLPCYYPGSKIANEYPWKRGRNIYVPAEHAEG